MESSQGCTDPTPCLGLLEAVPGAPQPPAALMWGRLCPRCPAVPAQAPHAAPFPPYPPCLAQEGWDGGAGAELGLTPSLCPTFQGSPASTFLVLEEEEAAGQDATPPRCLSLGMLSLIPQPPFQGTQWGGGGGPHVRGGCTSPGCVGSQREAPKKGRAELRRHGATSRPGGTL